MYVLLVNAKAVIHKVSNTKDQDKLSPPKKNTENFGLKIEEYSLVVTNGTIIISTEMVRVHEPRISNIIIMLSNQRII